MPAVMFIPNKGLSLQKAYSPMTKSPNKAFRFKKWIGPGKTLFASAVRSLGDCFAALTMTASWG
jgi:hypothetical protein